MAVEPGVRRPRAFPAPARPASPSQARGQTPLPVQLRSPALARYQTSGRGQRGAGPTGTSRLPSRTRHRNRRVEAIILILILGIFAFGVQAIWTRFTSNPAPLLTAAAAGNTLPAPQTQALATRAPAATPTPPITFSFARFEADPALVAGAASAGVPNLSGEAGIVVDVNTKDVIYAKQPHKRLLIASTTKIMTGIIVAERAASFDTVITVPVEAKQIEPNHMGIRTGEKLTVRELLYGMMLDSGNDAAEALAYGVGGGGASGRAQFITWMNEKATQLGLANTRFNNPSGLDHAEQYSTVYDLAVIGAYALTKPDLRQIFGTKDIVLNPTKEHGWFGPYNLNELLRSYPGAIGIKPGYTEDAGYTLVAAAERNGRTLIAVTLNSRLHFSDATMLLNFGFNPPTAPQTIATPGKAPAGRST